jgi:hypothetical protein
MIQTHSDCKQHISISLTDYETVAEIMNQDVGVDPATIALAVSLAAWGLNWLRRNNLPVSKIIDWAGWDNAILKMDKNNLPTRPAKFMLWDGTDPPDGYISVLIFWDPKFVADGILKWGTSSTQTRRTNYLNWCTRVASKLGISVLNVMNNYYYCWNQPMPKMSCLGQWPQTPYLIHQKGFKTIHIALPPGVDLPPPGWEPPNGNGGPALAGMFGDLLNLIKKFWYVPAGMLAITGVMLMFPRGRKMVLPKEWYDKIQPRRRMIKGGL